MLLSFTRRLIPSFGTQRSRPPDGLRGVLRDDRRESIVDVLPELLEAREVAREVFLVESELRREAVLLLLVVSDQRELEREPLRPFLCFLRFFCFPSFLRFLSFLSPLRPRDGTAAATFEVDKFRLNID